jgi:tRNA A37 threonylcarbamoyladenosine dehydratase
VAVIGLGAVGGYVAEGLARAGVGRLTLVDFDTVQPSNINRQLLALDSTVGEPKVNAAKERIHQINPACLVDALQLFADSETIEQIIAEKPDVIIDAIDSLNPKVQVLSAAVKNTITVFSSMGAALRTDPSQIKTGDISETRNCPLARRLRKRLRGLGIDHGIFCVYSTEPVDFSYQPPAADEDETNPLAKRGRKRVTLGSLPTLTGIFGLILANKAIMHLAGTKK